MSKTEEADNKFTRVSILKDDFDMEECRAAAEQGNENALAALDRLGF